MSFAHPDALLGLLLVPLLLIFYMWRAQHQRRVVSSTWLWQEALARFTHHPTRRLPLREPLLLLQILATLVLTALLAGPALVRPARVHRIVVLDGSAAMAATDVGPSRYVAAIRRARALLDGRGDDQTISLVLAGPQARLLGQAPGGAALGAVLDRLPAPGGPADLSGAATMVRGLAAAAGQGSPEVLFLASAQTPAMALAGLPVRTERFGGALDDQGIDRFSVRCAADGTSCQAFARVRNSAPRAVADTFAVAADGRALGRQALQLAAGGSLELDFAVPASARTLEATLLRPDALAADNTAWALVPVAPLLHAVLASDNPGPIMRTLRRVPGLSVQVVATSQFQDSVAAGLDLAILDGIAPDLPPAPTLFLNPPADNTVLPLQPSSATLSVGQTDPSDPLLAGLDLSRLAVTGHRATVPDWLQVAADGPGGAVVLHGTTGGQRMAFLPWTTAGSAAAQDPTYPLLLERLVRWLAPLPPATVAPGALVTVPASVGSVRDPAGSVLQGPLVVAALPGLYRVEAGSGAYPGGTPLFTVPPVAPGQAILVSAAPLIRIRAPGGSGLPLALWPPVLVAALLALAAEWWFYARKT